MGFLGLQSRRLALAWECDRRGWAGNGYPDGLWYYVASVILLGAWIWGWANYQWISTTLLAGLNKFYCVCTILLGYYGQTILYFSGQFLDIAYNFVLSQPLMSCSLTMMDFSHISGCPVSTIIQYALLFFVFIIGSKNLSCFRQRSHQVASSQPVRHSSCLKKLKKSVWCMRAAIACALDVYSK